MTWIIKVVGCDDTTTIALDLTPVEAEFVQRLASLISAASTYGCMPKMEAAETTRPLCEHLVEVGEFCGDCPDYVATRLSHPTTAAPR